MERGNIIFANDTPANDFFSSLTSKSRIIICDKNTKIHCLPLLEKAVGAREVIEVPAGEEFKNLSTCELIWKKLTDAHCDRHTTVVVIGGGVLGDMGGFCASTFKRGVDFILVPTTLLAQVDASVGGKLGIDFQDYKNHIGVFNEPVCTYIDTQFLKTLPTRELRSGFAEIIKHCLIADEEMWGVISSRSLEQQDWPTLVRHSVAFKKNVTTQDPKESGLRKILNFGHTIGHAIESYFLQAGNRIFHGEAIAMGMIMEAYIAVGKKLITPEECESITKYLVKTYGAGNGTWNDEEVLRRMAQDKKNREDKILMALPKRIGSAVWDVEVTRGEIEQSFGYYRSR